MSEPTADYKVYDQWDNGEFNTGCKLDLILNGEVVATESFFGSTEFEGGEVATRQAISYAQAWVESQVYTLEERLGPFGLEWEREQEERYA